VRQAIVRARPSKVARASGITTLAQALARIRQLERENAMLERLSVTDPLTGLSNRRHIRERLELAVGQAERGIPVSMVMIDLDHFKSYNDAYGHVAGDQLLMHVGACLRDLVRKTDCAARWGGEEFAVVLTGTPHEGAKVVAEKIRQAIALLPAHREVSASVGICSWEPGLSSEQLVKRADQALYMAKRTGRNRVRSSTEPNVVGASDE
jgi:diguanylate cyclase (GGDEF)-like protein